MRLRLIHTLALIFTTVIIVTSFYLYERVTQRELPTHLANTQINSKHVKGNEQFTKRHELTVDDHLNNNRPDEFDIASIYDQLAFDNKPGDAWKQGFPITYSMNQWEQRPLQVFVVPHSHQDPGWIRTVDEYFAQLTKHCLDSTLHTLRTRPEARFIYAEVSYFSMWVDTLDGAQKLALKQLLDNGQLEITSGGWVMTDEATAHFYAMMDQLMEGNHWLMDNFAYRPNTSWSIDPFGQSTTMAYLVHKMRLRGMVIGRVHYEVKRYLAERQAMEFRWKQLWDRDGHTEMLSHLLPFYSYDVPHTCGPDPSVCCQFDFERLIPSLQCPWSKQPVPITESNVAERAMLLADQYRKKATLYGAGHGLLLVPLGDDFRYLSVGAWNMQLDNYNKIMNYLNTHPEHRIKVRFATLSDYFSAVQAEYQDDRFPLFRGDLFTYADRNQDYWSGYFTSRPCQKLLTRQLQSEIRSAEVLYTYAMRLVNLNQATSPSIRDIIRRAFHNLTLARRSLGLFQHHDAVTGTAKPHVVADYSVKLLKAIDHVRFVNAICAAFLLLQSDTRHPVNQLIHLANQLIQLHPTTPEQFRSLEDQLFVHDVARPVPVFNSDQPRLVYLFNPSGHTRSSLVKLHLPVPISPSLQISVDIEHQRQSIPVQLNDHGGNAASSVYFGPIQLPPMSLLRVELENVAENPRPVFVTRQEVPDKTQPLVLESEAIRLTFDSNTGFLQTWQNKQSGWTVQTSIDFVVYSEAPGSVHSGAYLFHPLGSGETMRLPEHPVIRLTRGNLVDQITVYTELVMHTVKLFKHADQPALDHVDIENVVNLNSYTHQSIDLSMRIRTNLSNTDRSLFTDANCFQFVRRKYYDKLPLQGNLYPITCAVYMNSIEGFRLNLLTRHSVGVCGPRTGELQVWLDRRSKMDDNRGLGVPLSGQWNATSHFRLAVESQLNIQDVPSLTLNAYRLLAELTQPIQRFEADAAIFHSAPSVFQLMPKFELPCDYELVSLKTFHTNASVFKAIDSSDSDTRVGAVLRRLSYTPSSSHSSSMQCSLSDSALPVSDLFKLLGFTRALISPLSLIPDLTAKPSWIRSLQLRPSELEAFVLN